MPGYSVLSQPSSFFSDQQKLIYKFPFNNPLFLNHPLLTQWQLSDTILITAYDIIKNESLFHYLMKQGLTFKEYLHDRWFNREVKIMADTGIFEYEIRKARLDLRFPSRIDWEFQYRFTAEEIYHVYQLIDSDYMVSPDEIILQSDDQQAVLRKLKLIEDQLDHMLDIFPRARIIPVVQGFTEGHLHQQFQKIKDVGLTKNKVARGGLIPLWRESKYKFVDVVQLTDLLSIDYGINDLHSFGLPNLKTLKSYFYDNHNYTSVDTSIIYFRTAQRKFLTNKGFFIAVRNAHFHKCMCEGCRLMKKRTRQPTSPDFAIGLYYHNCLTLNYLISKLKDDHMIFHRKKIFFHNRNYQSSLSLKTINYNNLLTPAMTLYTEKKPRRTHYLYRNSPVQKLEKKVLIISSCTKSKLFKPTLSLFDLKTREQRELILNKDNINDIPNTKANKLYTGKKVKKLNFIVRLMRKYGLDVDLFFISAGFGLVHETDLLPSYDCSFSNKTKSQIITRSRELEIVKQIKQRITKYYDLVFLALPENYLHALESDALTPLEDLFRTGELVYFDALTFLEEDGLVSINLQELREFDKQESYFPFAFEQTNKVNLLQNYFYFFINGQSDTMRDMVKNAFCRDNIKQYRLI